VDRNILLQLEPHELLLQDIALRLVPVDSILRYEIDGDVVVADLQRLQFRGECFDRGIHFLAAFGQGLAFLRNAEDGDILIGLNVHQHAGLNEHAGRSRGQLMFGQHAQRELALRGSGLASRF
jgi:hypothetical protein